MLTTAITNAMKEVSKCDINNLSEEKKRYDVNIISNSFRSLDRINDGKDITYHFRIR